MAEELEFTYADFDVSEYIGEPPLLRLKINLKNNGEEDVLIPQVKFGVQLLGIPPRSMDSTYKDKGRLGEYASAPIYLRRGEASELECHIPVNAPKLEKMLDIRYEGDLVGFTISCRGLVLRISFREVRHEISSLASTPLSAVVQYPLGQKKIGWVVFRTEDFDRLLERLKHYELVRFEIPLGQGKSPAQKDLNEAAKLLISAKEGLIHGNYEGAMLDVRNSVYNHLTQELKGETEEENRDKQRVIKEEIKEFILRNVPEKDKDIYREVVRSLNNVLRGITGVLSKFIHKDRVAVRPGREDVELCYFLTLSVVKRLSHQLY